MFQKVGYGGGPIFKVVQSVKKGVLNRAVDTLRRQGEKGAQAPFDAKCVKFWLEIHQGPAVCTEKHFYCNMRITFEPNVTQRSVASQNYHKSKACLP